MRCGSDFGAGCSGARSPTRRGEPAQARDSRSDHSSLVVGEALALCSRDALALSRAKLEDRHTRALFDTARARLRRALGNRNVPARRTAGRPRVAPAEFGVNSAPSCRKSEGARTGAVSRARRGALRFGHPSDPQNFDALYPWLLHGQTSLTKQFFGEAVNKIRSADAFSRGSAQQPPRRRSHICLRSAGVIHILPKRC